MIAVALLVLTCGGGRLTCDDMFGSLQERTFRLDTDLAELGSLSYIQEDRSKPGVLLGLISNNLVKFSAMNSSKIQLYFNVTAYLDSNLSMSSELTSFYQLEDEILIADAGLRCVHSLARFNHTLRTHSGRCTDEKAPKPTWDFRQTQKTSTDGTFETATYTRPTELASWGAGSSKVYLADDRMIRLLNLTTETVSTVYDSSAHSFKTYSHMVFTENFVLLSGDYGLTFMDANFTVKDQLKFEFTLSQQTGRRKRQYSYRYTYGSSRFSFGRVSVTQTYGFQSLVSLNDSHVVAVRTRCRVTSPCDVTGGQQIRELVLINLRTKEMQGLCTSQSYREQNCCNNTLLEPNFIRRINDSIFMTSVTVADGQSIHILGGAQPGLYVCPDVAVGHFCSNRTDYIPVPCPVGTYSNTSGLTDASECTACDPGTYCAESGLNAPSGLCDAGYYCVTANREPTPLGVDVPADNDTSVSLIGGTCWVGHFCPTGSRIPLECQPGTYQPNYGGDSCLRCPGGFYCPKSGMDDYKSYPCEDNHYCPEGSRTSIPCDLGTDNPHLKSANQSWCAFDCISAEEICTGITNTTEVEIKQENNDIKLPLTIVGVSLALLCIAIIIGLKFRKTCKKHRHKKKDNINCPSKYQDSTALNADDASIAVSVNDKDKGVNMTSASAENLYNEINDEIYDTINESDMDSIISSTAGDLASGPADCIFVSGNQNDCGNVVDRRELVNDQIFIYVEDTQHENIVYVDNATCMNMDS